MQLIYRPSGRALEYVDGDGWALNHYKRCGHGCDYCYAPKALHMKPEEFHKPAIPRADAINMLSADCMALHRSGDTRPVFMSFSTDPYNPADVSYGITREVLIVLFTYQRPVILLTKGGRRSMRDFDLLAANADKMKYGATLVFDEDSEAVQHEPYAAPTSERIEALRAAHDMGIRTWVSLEPVIHSMDTLRLIDLTHKFVDHYKIGKVNYQPSSIDWIGFTHAAIEKLEGYGKDYYIKKDLREISGVR